MTTTELVKALRVCSRRTDCKGCGACPLFDNKDCMGDVTAGAADLIEWLIGANKDLHEELEWKDMVISLAQRKQAEAEAERDALIKQIKERHDCLDCKHNDFCEFDNANVIDCMNCVKKNCPCAQCCDSSRWEWCGLPEAPEEGEKA